MDSRLNNRVLLRLLFLLLLSIAIGLSIYVFYGEQIIRDLYQGYVPFTSIEFSSTQPDRPLEYFYLRAEIIVWQFIVVGLPLSLILWVVMFKVFRRLVKVQEPSANLSETIPVKQFKYDVWLAAGVYLVLTAIYSHRILDSFSTAMIGPAEDNMFFYWNYWWLNAKVLGGTASLTYTDYLFHPEGANMYYHSWTFYNLGLSALLRQFFNPVTSYNIIALHSFPLAGISAFLLVKYLTKNSYLALLGGFIFAFSPYHFARGLHHMNLCAIHFIPLFVLFYIKSIREKRFLNLILAGMFLLFNALTTWMYLIFSGYFIMLSYIYLAMRRRRIILTDVIWKSAVIVGIAVLFVSPWLYNMATIAFTHSEVGGIGRTIFVTDLFAPFVPGHYHWLGGVEPFDSINSSFTGNEWEATTYLGIVALIVVLIGARKRLPTVAKYLAGSLAFLLFSLGPELHVLGLAIPIGLPDSVVAYLPFVSSVRVPARNIVFVYLFWSILVPIATAHIVQGAKTVRASRLLLLLIPLLLVVDYSKVFTEETEIHVPECYQGMSNQRESFAILDLPDGYIANQSYKLYQTFHDRPIVEGHVSRKLKKTLIDRLDMENLDRQKEELIDAGVKYIFLHKNLQIEETIEPEKYDLVYPRVCEDEKTIMYQVY